LFELKLKCGLKVKSPRVGRKVATKLRKKQGRGKRGEQSKLLLFPSNKIFVERHLQSHFQAQCTFKVMRSTCPRFSHPPFSHLPHFPYSTFWPTGSCSSFYCQRSPFYGLVSGCLVWLMWTRMRIPVLQPLFPVPWLF